MTLNSLGNKEVLILGFGREGKDTFRFLKKLFPKKVLGVADQAPLSYVFDGRQKDTATVKKHFGRGYLNAIKNYDIIIKSPGIAPHIIAPFLTKKQIVTSQTDIFFENCPGTIVGVTGTKGKSTTASLIDAVLKSGGVHSRLIGNIGEPVLKYLKNAGPNDVFVYELSSFQLTNLKESPHIAVLLNIYPEHLDYYNGSFEEYAKAKANITTHQTETDFLLYNAKDPIVSKIANQSKAQKIPFGSAKLGLAKFNLAKPSFLASAEPAILVGKLFGIPEAKIQSAIKKFKPLPHRLEKVGTYKNITFYNDSLATIPQAACLAIDALGPKVRTLIAGGFDRGISYEQLGKKIRESNLKTLILFPTTGKKILQSLPYSKKQIQYFFAKKMAEAVALAYAHTSPGAICLLSPASSSFNMFKDYKDRGDQFKKFVTRYGKKK